MGVTVLFHGYMYGWMDGTRKVRCDLLVTSVVCAMKE